MSARIPLLSAAWIAVLLGCTTSTPPSSPEASAAPTNLFLPDNPPEYPPGETAKFCQLGSSCLTMDPRPFELCLLSDKRCGDKLAETILVEQSNIVVKPGKPR